VRSIGAHFITYRATGTVAIGLQWGSNSDLRRGDGAEADLSFPFHCDIQVSLDDPLNMAFSDTNYSVGAQFGLIAFTGAVLGGVGNLLGAVIGGYVIGLVQAFNDGLPYGLGQQWSQSVVFLVLILLLVFRPEGLLGTRTVESV